MVFIAAPRYMITEKHNAEVETNLTPHLVNFVVNPLNDPSLAVAKVALESLKQIAYTRPTVLVSVLGEVLAALFLAAKRSNRKVRKFGPLEQIEDDAEGNRLLAFECLDLLVKLSASRVNMVEFVRTAVSGLQDHFHHVQLKSQLLLIHLVESLAVDVVVASIGPICDALRITFTPPTPEQGTENAIDIANKEEAALGGLKVVSVLMGVRQARHTPNLKNLIGVIRTCKYAQFADLK
jgi:hypothetical protein